MPTEEWMQAARDYSRMPEQARAEYWGRLTPDQQGFLQAALISTGPDASSSSATGEPLSTPPRRGCSSPLAAGCIGMILGCILTLGVQVVALMMGFQAVGSLFQSPSGNISSSSDTDPDTSQSPSVDQGGYDPMEDQKRLNEEREEYRQQNQ